MECEGLNDLEKRVLLRNVLRDWNCNLICLQETKLEDVELSDIRSIWGTSMLGFLGFSVFKAIGSPGGVLVLWNTKSFQLVSSSCGDFSITCILQMVDGNFFWAFTGMHDRDDKLRMLDELGSVRDRWTGPGVYGGFQ